MSSRSFVESLPPKSARSVIIVRNIVAPTSPTLHFILLERRCLGFLCPLLVALSNAAQESMVDFSVTFQIVSSGTVTAVFTEVTLCDALVRSPKRWPNLRWTTQFWDQLSASQLCETQPRHRNRYSNRLIGLDDATLVCGAPSWARTA